jgi:hypothetical protein
MDRDENVIDIPFLKSMMPKSSSGDAELVKRL